jgi:hypothetical protein
MSASGRKGREARVSVPRFNPLLIRGGAILRRTPNIMPRQQVTVATKKLKARE